MVRDVPRRRGNAVQGWYLLEKSGLDTLERSVIQGDLRSNFTLLGVENALRSHWTDEQVRRRDGDPKHYAAFQDYEEDCSDPEPEPDEAFFEAWTEAEKAWWNEAREEEHQAWVQMQAARRTLKEARAKQHEVKLGRRFYRPKGQGKGKAGPIGSNPRQGPCLKCGKGHATADCPTNSTAARSAAYVEEPEHLAEFTFFGDKDELEHQAESTFFGGQDEQEEKNPPQQLEPEEHGLAAWTTRALSTEEAIANGMAVLDPGATKTMGSVYAVDRLMTKYQKEHGHSNIIKIDTEERPVFGFGNSMQSKCVSTAYLKVPRAQAPIQMKVHVLDEGKAPVLLSIDSLRRLGAIVDFSKNEAIFTSLDPKRLVHLQQSQAGHQLLNLGRDIFEGSEVLQRAVYSLRGPE